MDAAGTYTLAPEQYLRVLAAGLTGLLDSVDAGAERESLRDDVDALLLLAYQGQEVASEETPAAKDSKKEAPKEQQRPLFAIATDLEEAAALLRGVLDGLQEATDDYEHPRSSHMRILLDRFDTELARVEKQTHAVYALNAGTGKAEAAR
jgi:hypothetical protein